MKYYFFSVTKSSIEGYFENAWAMKRWFEIHSDQNRHPYWKLQRNKSWLWSFPQGSLKPELFQVCLSSTTKQVTSLFPLCVFSFSLSQPDPMVSSRHLLLINTKSQINESRRRAMLQGIQGSLGYMVPH